MCMVYGCKSRIPIISNLCRFVTRQDLACGRSGSNFSTQVMTSHRTDKDQTSNSETRYLFQAKLNSKAVILLVPFNGISLVPLQTL